MKRNPVHRQIVAGCFLLWPGYELPTQLVRMGRAFCIFSHLDYSISTLEKIRCFRNNVRRREFGRQPDILLLRF